MFESSSSRPPSSAGSHPPTRRSAFIPPSSSPSGEILSDEDELDDDFEFVSKGLLQKYLEDPNATQPMTAAERINFMCAHGKLNIDLLGELKVSL